MNFETIFAAALKTYNKQTKKDIASHPLAVQLQSCDSPSTILAVLKAQVQAFDESQNADEKLTKWLDPTVNVLYSFSATLGNGVGLVRCERYSRSIYTVLSVRIQIFPASNAIFAGIGVLLQVSVSLNRRASLVKLLFLRPLGTFAPVKMPFSTCLAAWNTFSSASRHI